MVPVSIKAADRFVAAHHRHHGPTYGKAKFALGAERNGQLVGVIVVGRPKGRLADDGERLEAVRICTHGDCHNAVSFLWARARRAARALGYSEPLLTYIEEGESAVSLIAAGACKVADVKADDGNRPSRPRSRSCATVPRERWEAVG